MKAPLEGSERFGRTVRSTLSTSQTDTLRSLLLAESGELIDRLSHCAGAFVVPSPVETTGLGRAMVALDMYLARQAIEEIDAALVRIDAGGYGRCLVCDRSIPFEHLVATPQARHCAACSCRSGRRR